MGGGEKGTLSASDRAPTALLGAAAALWPPPAVVSVIPGRGRRRRPGAEHVLLPSARRPELVLPAGQRRAAATVVAGRDGSTAIGRRVANACLGAATRLGAADLLARARLHIEHDPGDDRDDIEVVLERILGTPPLLSIRLGSARANQKPVLQVLDRAGATLAYVKVADNPFVAQLVDREAAALELLADADLRLARVPEVLHHGSWRGLRLLVLSPLGGRRRLRQPMPLAAMAELARAGGQSGQLAGSPFWDRIRAAAASLREAELVDRLTAVVEVVENRMGAADMDLGWAHGDWSPWNMAWRSRVVDVWDWERFEQSAPVGCDALHHCFQAALRRSGDRGRGLAELDARAPQLVRAVGSTTPADAVVELYLVDLAARYLTASESPLGDHVRPLARWALAVVEARAAA